MKIARSEGNQGAFALATGTCICQNYAHSGKQTSWEFKMMMKSIFAAIASTALLAGAAGAATLTGSFTVFAAQKTNLNSEQSEATFDNIQDAFLDGASNVFTYTGALDFGTFDTANDATTIKQWLDTGGGTVLGLDETFGDLQLSKPDINSNPASATSTFFLFSLDSALGAASFTVTHDDGMAIFNNAVRIGGFNGPNSQRVTEVSGFSGGTFELIYVATNGDPSVLKVDMSPIPAPAALPLLLAGVGGFAFLRRRRRT